MTSYRISVGYNSAQDKKDVADTMIGAMMALQVDTSLIVEEVLRIEPGFDKEELDYYATAYAPGTPDLTVRVDEEDGFPVIVQFASGGGEGRSIKEALRRAVCRRIMQECHKNQMEVNITVG